MALTFRSIKYNFSLYSSELVIWLTHLIFLFEQMESYASIVEDCSPVTTGVPMIPYLTVFFDKRTTLDIASFGESMSFPCTVCYFFILLQKFYSPCVFNYDVHKILFGVYSLMCLSSKVPLKNFVCCFSNCFMTFNKLE